MPHAKVPGDVDGDLRCLFSAICGRHEPGRKRLPARTGGWPQPGVVVFHHQGSILPGINQWEF